MKKSTKKNNHLSLNDEPYLEQQVICLKKSKKDGVSPPVILHKKYTIQAIKKCLKCNCIAVDVGIRIESENLNDYKIQTCNCNDSLLISSIWWIDYTYHFIPDKPLSKTEKIERLMDQMGYERYN